MPKQDQMRMGKIGCNKILLAIFIFLYCFTIRSLFIIPTIQNDGIKTTVYRVGMIPLSDASAYVAGADSILSGRDLNYGPPSYRPLYPAFLATVFYVLGMRSYLPVIILQTAMLAFAISFSWYILRNSKQKSAVTLFIMLLSLWRIGVTAELCTECLGICLLILSVACIWRGCEENKTDYCFSGLFLYGLAQAVRPWNVMSLITIPFMAALERVNFKKKIRRCVLYFIVLLIGFGFHFFAVKLFNGKDSGSNYPMTLYGQVAGGKGWESVFDDEIISKYWPMVMDKKISMKEYNQIIYKRIAELFLEDPKPFFAGTIEAFSRFFRAIPLVFNFGQDPPFNGKLIKALMILQLVLYIFIKTFNTATEKRPGKIWPALMFSLLPFTFMVLWDQHNLVLTCFLAISLIYVIKHRMVAMNFLFLCIFSGSLLSLPFVGAEGGERVKIVNDATILFFFSSGLGCLLDNRFGAKPASVGTRFDKTVLSKPLIAMIAMFCIFIGCPWLMKGGIEQQKKLDKIPLEVDPVDLYKSFFRDSRFSRERLNQISSQWPSQSFAVGKQVVYQIIDVHLRNAFFFRAGEGTRSDRKTRFPWPFYPLNFGRTLLFQNFQFTIFPNTSKTDLAFIEGKEILALGHLISKKKTNSGDVGHAFLVSHIAYHDNKTKKMKWVEIGSID